MGGAAVCYSYSCSKGAFAGVSIEGSLLTTRNDVNLNFYGGPPLAAIPPGCFVSALRWESLGQQSYLLINIILSSSAMNDLRMRQATSFTSESIQRNDAEALEQLH